MSKDLGTYFVEVVFTDNTGFIMEWTTGGRYTHGTRGWTKLGATYLKPTYDDEADVLDGIHYMFTEGNYACDCNLMLFRDRGNQLEELEYDCGETLKLKKLTAITPDRRKINLLSKYLVN